MLQLSGLLLLMFLVTAPAYAKDNYSPYADSDYPQNVYWGDTHLHTAMSADAYTWGGNRQGPETAYRFARGETVHHQNGMPVRLRRPLDFIVVADHAEWLGTMGELAAGNALLLETEQGEKLHKQLAEIVSGAGEVNASSWQFFLDNLSGINQLTQGAFLKSMWHQVIANAEKFNQPHRFTAFIGFEWSSGGRENKGNLHRVVIFADGADKAGKVAPFSARDSRDPEQLWRYMQRYEESTNSKILAIPHNGNVSHGEMFKPLTFAGEAIDRDYAMARSHWEPLFEVTQMKGDSETHPLLSPTDEFADYETWDNWGGKVFNRAWTKEEKAYKKYEYARSALKLGLTRQAELGVNPFKFGMIGSTDSHNGLAVADENNFWGKFSIDAPSAQRAIEPSLPSLFLNAAAGWQSNAAGYAAVWAKENTREALFDAMRRKEVYGTTGPRIKVRFFGGWDYLQDDAIRPELAITGYKKGVPMGGELTQAPANRAPRFLIQAVKDPDGANLDRVQVIKGWRAADGKLHEKIYNVALSGDRKDKGINTKRVGSTVDARNASYTNSIGAAELAVVWEDPDFNASEQAFYYLRVIETPTPRWTAYDASYFGIKELPKEAPLVTQERAYTSPIWYTP